MREGQRINTKYCEYWHLLTRKRLALNNTKLCVWELTSSGDLRHDAAVYKSATCHMTLLEITPVKL